VSPQLEQLKKEGEAGRRRLLIHSYGTVLLALVQSARWLWLASQGISFS